MGKISMGFGKTLLICAVTALGMAAARVNSALALTTSDATPLPATVADQRLELVWARQQAEHARLTIIFDSAGERSARVQQLIDRAKAKGKDVTDLQSALDNLENAIKEARPVFESTNGIIASHQGFDANGNVTDVTTALATVRDLGEKYQEIRTIVQPALQAFRQAVRDYRRTNSPAATPGS